MSSVLLVRHAQSLWNAERRWQGWADPPLSPLGRHQAAEAAGRLPFAPRAWASSDLVRARTTAELLGGAGAVCTDPDLREYDAGDWTGLRRQDIEARWPEELAAWDGGRLDAVPGGEAAGDFASRLERGLRRCAAEAVGRPLVVVSHGRAIHAVAVALGAPSLYVAHLAGLELASEPDGTLRVVGEVALLAPTAAAAAVPDPDADAGRSL